MAERIEIALTAAAMPDRPERADAAANRTLVLATAERLFAEHGVAAVTMADIAEAAGIGKGTLYRRYANKGELALALMDTQLSEFQNRMLAGFSAMQAAGEPYLAQLTHYFTELVAFTERHMPLLCEVQHGGLLLDNAHPNLPHFWHAMTVTGLLRAAQRAGEVSPQLDVDFTAELLLASLQADVLRFQREVRGFSNERIVAGLTGLIETLGVA